MSDRTELLDKIKEGVTNLKSSPLYKERIKNKVFPVIGEGSDRARIMFIGEAPGRNEAKAGRPFCGAAGKILEQLLKSAGIKREDIYITNIVKDRPPSNRDPLPEEIKVYGPFLNKEIEIIKPAVLVTLGRFSMDYIMRKFNLEDQVKPISQIHGKVFDAVADYGSINIVPLYHPAVAIYNRKTLETLKSDFKILKKFK